MSRATEPTTDLPTKLTEFYRPIARQLEEVEALLAREMRNPHPAVDAMTRYGCRMGGKRLRPALLLLTANAVGKPAKTHTLLGAVVEMIHTATLVHDDVLDSAAVRRHQRTANECWGNRQSILLGDYLFSHAFYLAATLDSTLACQVIGRATNRVCEGEIRQNDSCGKWDLDEAEYYELIDAKTAELCACCCHLGAHYAGAGPEETKRWTEYGRCIGMAFQIIDDILDIEGLPGQTGKSLGTDLAQQKPTLPMIRVLQEVDEQQRGELLELLGSDQVESALLEPWLERFEACDYARARAREFADRAVAIASEWPPNESQQILQALPAALLARRT